MLRFVRLVSTAAILIGALSALPVSAIPVTPPSGDSAINEPAVSAPNGIPITDSTSATQTVAPPQGALAQASSSSSSATTTAMTMATSMSSMMMMGTTTSTSMSAQVTEALAQGMSPPQYNSGMSPPQYGSGMTNWGGNGYDSCIQQCMTTYSQPPTMWSPSPPSGESGSKGTGATHTVIVAPTQGVLRYVPFALNASVGDTIVYRWGANNHTVTKSSALLPCNKTADSPFTSGTQNKGFEFTQVVNSTETIWFYCGTPTHCQKGMFGAVNPPSTFGSSTSVAMVAQDMVSKSPEVSAMWSKVKQDCKGNDRALNWGSSMEMKAMPEWAKSSFIENVMYTRSFLAANPDTLKSDGTIDFGNSTIKFPQDFAATVNKASAMSPTNSSSPAANATSTDSASITSASSNATATPEAKKASGAFSVASPHALVPVAVAVVALLAL